MCTCVSFLYMRILSLSTLIVVYMRILYTFGSSDISETGGPQELYLYFYCISTCFFVLVLHLFLQLDQVNGHFVSRDREWDCRSICICNICAFCVVFYIQYALYVFVLVFDWVFVLVWVLVFVLVIHLDQANGTSVLAVRDWDGAFSMCQVCN